MLKVQPGPVCKVGQLLHSLPVTGDLWSFPIPRDQGLAANPLG